MLVLKLTNELQFYACLYSNWPSQNVEYIKIKQFSVFMKFDFTVMELCIVIYEVCPNLNKKKPSIHLLCIFSLKILSNHNETHIRIQGKSGHLVQLSRFEWFRGRKGTIRFDQRNGWVHFDAGRKEVFAHRRTRWLCWCSTVISDSISTD